MADAIVEPFSTQTEVENMTHMTFELPDSLKAHVDARIAAGEFPNTSAYLQALIAVDRRRAEIDLTLLESLDEYKRGECSEWKPGDTRRLWEEIKQHRRGAD